MKGTMVITFEYWTRTMHKGRMFVDLEEFFPNTISKTRKLFKFMLPNLEEQEIEKWLTGKEGKCYKKYLELLKAIQKYLCELVIASYSDFLIVYD